MIDLRCILGFHQWDGVTSDPATRCRRCGRFYGLRDAVVSGACVGLAIVALVWLLAGCACVRPLGPGDDGTPTAAAELASVGSWLVWIGGLGLALGLVGRLAVATPSFSFIRGTPIAGIVGFAAEACAVTLACGIALLWLANHIWLLIGACGLAGLAWAWRHRARIRKWLRLGTNPVPSSNNNPLS